MRTYWFDARYPSRPRLRCVRSCRVWLNTEQAGVPRWRVIPQEEKPVPQRSFRATTESSSFPLSDLHRWRIRRLLSIHWWTSRAYPSRIRAAAPPYFGQILPRTFSPISIFTGQGTAKRPKKELMKMYHPCSLKEVLQMKI